MNIDKVAQKELTEWFIIEKILGGEIELFEILMRRNNELLYRTIRSYVGTESDVEDTMQDTYIKAYEKLYQFKNETKFSTWLIRIGINEALQRKRKSSKHKTIALEQADMVLQIEDKNSMDPERKTMYTESSLFMEKAIDTLPEKYKIVYMLKEVEGIEISEICACLNLTNSNVKVRLHRAKVMLRDSLFAMTDLTNVFEFGNSKCDKMVANVMDHIFKTHTKP